MPKLYIVALLLLFPSMLLAQGYHPVRGYTRTDGTYVQPHYQTNPDGNVYNNWGTYPNTNPFTGEQGTKRYDSGSNGFGSSPYNSNSFHPLNTNSNHQSSGRYFDSE